MSESPCDTRKHADAFVSRFGRKPQPVVKALIRQCGSIAALERATGINRGLWSRVRDGGNSPTVNRYLFGCEKITRKQYRRCANFPDEETAIAFDAMLASRGTTLTAWMLAETAYWLLQGDRRDGHER